MKWGAGYEGTIKSVIMLGAAGKWIDEWGVSGQKGRVLVQIDGWKIGGRYKVLVREWYMESRYMGVDLVGSKILGVE